MSEVYREGLMKYRNFRNVLTRLKTFHRERLIFIRSGLSCLGSSV